MGTSAYALRVILEQNADILLIYTDGPPDVRIYDTKSLRAMHFFSYIFWTLRLIKVIDHGRFERIYYYGYNSLFTIILLWRLFATGYTTYNSTNQVIFIGNYLYLGLLSLIDIWSSYFLVKISVRILNDLNPNYDAYKIIQQILRSGILRIVLINFIPFVRLIVSITVVSVYNYQDDVSLIVYSLQSSMILMYLMDLSIIKIERNNIFKAEAISNVENTFDTLLEQPPESTNRTNKKNEDTEMYMDPITGMITTVPKKVTKSEDAKTPTTSTTKTSLPATPQRQQSDLSARLAAVLSDKKGRTSASSSSRPSSLRSKDSSDSLPLAIESNNNSNNNNEKKVEEITKTRTSLDDESKKNATERQENNSDDNAKTSDNTKEIDSDKSTINQLPLTEDNELKKDEKLDQHQNQQVNTLEKADTVSTTTDNNEDNDNDDDDDGGNDEENITIEDNIKLETNNIADSQTLIVDNTLDPIKGSSKKEEENNNNETTNKDETNIIPDDEDQSIKLMQNNLQPTLIDSKINNDDDVSNDDHEASNINVNSAIDTNNGDNNDSDNVVDKKEGLNIAHQEHTTSNNSIDNNTVHKEDGTINKKDDPILTADTEKAVIPSSSENINDARDSDKNNTDIDNDDIKNIDTTIPSNPVSSSDLDNDNKDKILAQREQQLLQAMETIAKLHDQIHNLQQEGEESNSQIKSLQDQLQNQSTSQSSSRNIKKYETVIQDLNKQLMNKEEQIQGLLQEGEKLSKNELKQTTVIKRLRAEKQEIEKNMTELQKKHDKLNSDLNESNIKSKRTIEAEKRAQETVKMLTEMTEKQTKHINKLESDSLKLKEQYQQIKVELATTLENLEAEKNKAKAESEEIHAAALEKEVAANGRLHKELTKMKETSETMESKLRSEIRELQIALQTLGSDAGIREDNLRKELMEIQMKLQEKDAYIDELSSNVEEIAAPLLRQIEDLQAQHSNAIKNRDLAEQRITIRLQQTEAECNKIKEELKSTNEKIMSLTERLSNKEQELTKEQQDKFTLKSTLETELQKNQILQQELEEKQKLLAEQNLRGTEVTENIKKQYQKLMKERLQEERKQWEIKHQHELAKIKKSVISPSPIKPSNGVTSPKNDDESSSINRPDSHSPSASSRSSIDSSYTGISQYSHLPVNIAVERLQATIKQMENQINFYQTQLQSASQSRDELSDEILVMSNEMEELRKEYKQLQGNQKDYDELNQRYQASLELLGERTEQVEELKADIADVKDMYRTQVVELVQKIDQLSKS
ncbi:hypothetical protein BJ944DRAFT_241684 [Cunninghamella echinulata]|nr:hypothetical protein BJ944DRAFT_241684 [Cunninghamella echinulata]